MYIWPLFFSVSYKSGTNNLEFPLHVKLQPLKKTRSWRKTIQRENFKAVQKRKYRFAHCKETLLFFYGPLQWMQNSWCLWIIRCTFPDDYTELWRRWKPNKKSEQVSVSLKTRIRVSRMDWTSPRLNSVHREECLPLSETKLMLFLKPANSSPRPHPSIKSHK